MAHSYNCEQIEKMVKSAAKTIFYDEMDWLIYKSNSSYALERGFLTREAVFEAFLEKHGKLPHEL